MGGATSVADAISRTGACLGLAFEGGEDVPRQKLPRYHLMLAIMLQMFYQYHFIWSGVLCYFQVNPLSSLYKASFKAHLSQGSSTSAVRELHLRHLVCGWGSS